MKIKTILACGVAVVTLPGVAAAQRRRGPSARSLFTVTGSGGVIYRISRTPHARDDCGLPSSCRRQPRAIFLTGLNKLPVLRGVPTCRGWAGNGGGGNGNLPAVFRKKTSWPCAISGVQRTLVMAGWTSGRPPTKRGWQRGC